jgi:uncharacterized membrane protein YeiH
MVSSMAKRVSSANRGAYIAGLGRDLRTGLRSGLALALSCSAVVIIVFFARGMAPFEPAFATPQALIAAFLTTGASGGLLFGVLHPWRSSVLGRLGLGAVIALAACLCTGLFAAAELSLPSASDWKAIGVFTLLGALIGAWGLRPRHDPALGSIRGP